MEIIPVKTRILQPPKDNLFGEIDKAIDQIKEQDVVVVTSKVVSIHQGRCIKINNETDKRKIIQSESDAFLSKSDERGWDISVKHSALLLSAGIDESNADGHLILLPEDPFPEARKIHTYISNKAGIDNIGVIISDSHSVPFRFGTLGISIGFWGIKPVIHFSGKRDLFGRKLNYTRINVVDSIAAAAVFSMGETTERIPIAIVRDAPHLEFSQKDERESLLIPPEEDIYYPLLRVMYDN